MGNPVCVYLYKLVQSLQTVVYIKLRYNKTLSGNVHSLEVLFGTEELNVSVGSSVCLHTLEDFLSVVKHHCGR